MEKALTKTDLGLMNEAYAVSGHSLVANVVHEAIKRRAYPTLPRKVDIIVNKVTEL